MSKRIHAVKVMLTDEELIAVQKQALAQDMSAGEVVRRNCMQFMFGILGLAERRRQKNRGADSELTGTDFQLSGFDNGIGAD